MKTAVSIPDALFERAKLFARHAKRTRSQLFSDALAEYLARHTGNEITEAMNRVMDVTGDAADPFIFAASQRTLSRVEWQVGRKRSGGPSCPRLQVPAQGIDGQL
jgi:hypothetical protein